VIAPLCAALTRAWQDDGMSRRAGVLATALLSVAVVATAAVAATANFAQYRTKVNALCRSYTPRIKRVEATMTAAQRAGNNRKVAEELGVLIGISLAEGTRVERVPVPADGQKRMAKPLRLLRSADTHARKLLTAAAAGNQAGVVTELTALDSASAPLNRAFDAVGLRDCGSNQS
jgi:hypothetical protein